LRDFSRVSGRESVLTLSPARPLVRVKPLFAAGREGLNNAVVQRMSPRRYAAQVRVNTAEFLALPLELHILLADVPLRDVSAVDLPGGGPRTIGDVRALVPQGPAAGGNPVVRALFGLRVVLGRLFGWDATGYDGPEHSYLSRLAPELRARSLAPPGQPEGAFRLLYQLEREMVFEIRNATVHAFLATVLIPRGADHRLYWAVYVKPVSWFTPIYMAMIEPFRRFLVYPSLLRMVRRRWQMRYAGAAD
jgi:hypothetical protein